MVAINKKKKTKKKGRDAHDKYYEQTDPNLPLYTITCLDNLYSPFDVIPIKVLRFRNDHGAKMFSIAYAKKNAWRVWEVNCDRRVVYYCNLSTGVVKG